MKNKNGAKAVVSDADVDNANTNNNNNLNPELHKASIAVSSAVDAAAVEKNKISPCASTIRKFYKLQQRIVSAGTQTF